MKALKELIQSNPVLILLILGIVIIYTLILFVYAGKEKVAAKIEKYSVFFILLCSPKLTYPPFNYLHPAELTAREIKSLALVQIGFYAVFF